MCGLSTPYLDNYFWLCRRRIYAGSSSICNHDRPIRLPIIVFLPIVGCCLLCSLINGEYLLVSIGHRVIFFLETATCSPISSKWIRILALRRRRNVVIYPFLILTELSNDFQWKFWNSRKRERGGGNQVKETAFSYPPCLVVLMMMMMVSLPFPRKNSWNLLIPIFMLVL